MHSLTYLLSVSRQRAGPTLARALPSPRLHCAILERKAHLPLHICTFLPSTGLQDCFLHFWRTMASSSKKLHKFVPRPRVLPNWNCALCNPSSQQQDWTVHYVVPAVSQSPNSPNYSCVALVVGLPTSRPKLFTQASCKSVLMFILVFDR